MRRYSIEHGVGPVLCLFDVKRETSLEIFITKNGQNQVSYADILAIHTSIYVQSVVLLVGEHHKNESTVCFLTGLAWLKARRACGCTGDSL